MSDPVQFPEIVKGNNPTQAPIWARIRDRAWQYLDEEIRKQVLKYLHLAKITVNTRHISVHTLNTYATKKGSAEPGICVILQSMWGAEVCRTRPWWPEYEKLAFVSELPKDMAPDVGFLPAGNKRSRGRAAKRPSGANPEAEAEMPPRRSTRGQSIVTPEEPKKRIRIKLRTPTNQGIQAATETESADSPVESVHDQPENMDENSFVSSTALPQMNSQRQMADERLARQVIEAKVHELEKERDEVRRSGEAYATHLEQVSEGLAARQSRWRPLSERHR
ncbi:hypothetical protein PT974_12023 [Cladobotryum mycophilum]|uniref:Uncharacterized protein n=1 Tax=Cladobotryum mycophilum TaxID=491253 RepID=A0ABR0S6U7_9HYPO